MAEILFIQSLPYEYPGTTSIAAVLKQHGHTVNLLIAPHPRQVDSALKPEQIVAFSVMTGMHHWAIATAERIKAKDKSFIIMGGPHPTYYPEIIENQYIDAICRGEGEYALLELAGAKDEKTDISRIKNLWLKVDGILHKNEPRPLIDNLDLLPDPDREVYYKKYKFIRNNSHKSFLAGRGCPFDCSFCFNRQLRELYQNKGSFVRLRSPERVVKEIEDVAKRYNLKKVFFHDDTFILDRKWLDKFLDLYEKRLKIPFYCNGRADTITPEIAKKLKMANCVTVSFAVESGNERIRKEILKKFISNAKLRDAAKTLKENGIKLVTYNIVGIPGETIDDAWETVRINIEMGVDYPRCSLLTPYPGIDITDYARKYGYLDTSVEEISTFSQQTNSFIRNADRKALINMHHLFQTAVIFPRSIMILKFLVKFPPNFIFKIWWSIIYFFIFTFSEGRGVCSMLRFSVGMWLVSLSKFKKL